MLSVAEFRDGLNKFQAGLNDEEVALIDRMLRGRRGGECNDYEHLSRIALG